MQVTESNDTSESTGQSDEIIQFLSFAVSNEIFGIDLIHVHEILRPVFITRIPNVEEHVLGVINLRGEIIPIIDLKKKFEQGFTEITKISRIIVLEFNSKRFLGNLIPILLNLDQDWKRTR